MARPTKLTEQLRERIVKAVRAGSYADTAARSCGIAPSTYHRWMARGEAESTGIYREFFKLVREAEAQAEIAAKPEAD